jgi:Tfp pilus assembly protein PilN
MNLRSLKDNLATIVAIIHLITVIVVLTTKFQKLEDGQALLQSQQSDLRRDLKDLATLDKRLSVAEVQLEILRGKK